MEATVDRSGCIGCGACEATCPEVFEIDGEGLAFVKAQPTEKTLDAAKEARDSCPVSVISIED